ncbi:MAG: LytR/AlgR family response regulator transcription factor, partial [Bryobacteraceae bacterium]
MPQRAPGIITTLVVDDEKPACDELIYLLKGFPGIEVLGAATNGIEAIRLIEQTEPDLVFLDVQMPGLDGFGVIRKLQEKKVPLPKFVLATAYDQYAVEGFRVQALDYLLKPIERERLALTLERARQALEEKSKAAEAPPLP